MNSKHKRRRNKTFRPGTKQGMSLAGMTAALILCCSGTLIWALPTVTVTNSFDTGIVQIQVEEYQLNEQGEECAWKDNPVVLPGQRISKIVRVTNHGNTCYIRAKADFCGIKELSDSCLYGIDRNWIQAADGYYYCLYPVERGESVDFFRGVQIPEMLEQSEEGSQFSLNVQVDAVQQRNIEPDFTDEEPWGKIEILKIANVGTGEVRIVQPGQRKKFVLEYQGEAAKLIVNEENFFGNVPTLLPGDEYTDGARLINNGERPVRLFFRSISNGGSDLLDKINLVIETETEGKNQVIYDGPIRGTELSTDILLMTIPARSSGRMVFAVYVPEELNNEYIQRDEAIQWIFSTEEIVLPGQAADTGDRRSVGGYMMLAGLSLGFAVRMIQRKRRTDGNTV